MYGFILLMGLLYIIFPLIGQRRFSVNLSMFLFSFGLVSLVNRDDPDAKLVSQSEYLRKSQRCQLAVGISFISYAVMTYLLQVPVAPTLVFFVVVGTLVDYIARMIMTQYKISPMM